MIAPSAKLEHMFDTRGAGSHRLDHARQVLAATESRLGVTGRPTGGAVRRAPADRADLYRAMAAAMGVSGWAGVVGLADIGWAAAAECGVALDRVLYVPDTAGCDGAVLAALVDGCALVVAGQARLAPSQARTLAARAHARGTTVLSIPAWPGAHTGEVG